MKTPRMRGQRWVTLRGRILHAEPLCRHCLARGHVTPADEVDHIIPLHKGGSNQRANLQPLCKPCHEDKTQADMNYRPAIGLDGWPIDE